VTQRADAIVLCIDEKSQIQALDRTAPMLAMQPGLPARRTHDHKRHGTTTLFAVLQIATGKVAHADFQSELQAVMDKYVHFTPISRPGLNLVDVWSGIIECQTTYHGTLTSVRDLHAKIRTFVNGWNDRAHPFFWTKAADEILKNSNRQITSNTRDDDVVLMDVQMPVVESLDAARIIASNPDLVLASKFVGEAPGLLDTLNAARTEGSCREVRRLAHTVEPHADLVDVARMQEPSRTVEELATLKQLVHADTAIDERRVDTTDVVGRMTVQIS